MNGIEKSAINLMPFSTGHIACGQRHFKQRYTRDLAMRIYKRLYTYNEQFVYICETEYKGKPYMYIVAIQPPKSNLWDNLEQAIKSAKAEVLRKQATALDGNNYVYAASDFDELPF